MTEIELLISRMKVAPASVKDMDGPYHLQQLILKPVA